MTETILLQRHEFLYYMVTKDIRLLVFANKPLWKILSISQQDKVTNTRMREHNKLQPEDDYMRYSRQKSLDYMDNRKERLKIHWYTLVYEMQRMQGRNVLDF